MSDVEQDSHDSKLNRAVRALRDTLHGAGAGNFRRLHEFESVSSSAKFGWMPSPTLHEAVHRFSDTLVHSWYCKSGGQLGTPSGRHDTIQRLAKLAIPDPVKVEDELVNEFRKTCRNSDDVDDYGKIHRTIVTLVHMAIEVCSLARNADETREDIGSDAEKKAQVIDPKAKRPKPVPATEATRKSKPRANNIDLVKGILTAHHLRKDDEVNYSPLTNRQIADNSKGAFRHSTARRCLIELFGNVEEYKRQCNDGIVEHFVRAFTAGLRSLRTFDPQKLAETLNDDGQMIRTGRKSKPVADED